MNENELKEVLNIILNKLNNKKFIWRLEGSANLFVQGVPVTIRDLDITTNDEGINIFRESLNEYITKDFFSQKINGHSIICDINGFEIEINSYGDRELQMFDKNKTISWQDIKIPILPLEYAKEFYKSINRVEKVELIEKFLKK